MKRKTLWCLLCLCALCCSHLAQARTWKVEDIPNTRVQMGNDVHVSNPDDILEPHLVDSINLVLNGVQSKCDVFVVAIDNMDSDDENDFSIQLATRWGIGTKGKDNGVLVLLVRETHFLRIETGYGTEGYLTDALCSRIRRNIMFPLFQQERYGEGVLAGCKALAKAIELGNADEAEQALGLSDDSDDSFWSVLLGIIAAVAGTLGLGAVAAYIKRRRPRKCTVCGKRMRRLSEDEEDEYLTRQQQAEETHQSRDYDVWLCDHCHHVVIYSYADKQARHFTRCRQCGARLSEEYYRVTTVQPTYLHAGTEVVSYRCRYCGHDERITHTLPRKEMVVIAGGGGFGGGSGGFSGGSFGGGSFGGGGSGGHW